MAPVNRINFKLPFQEREISLVDSSRPSKDQEFSIDIALPFSKVPVDHASTSKHRDDKQLVDKIAQRLHDHTRRRRCHAQYLRSAPTAEANFVRSNKPTYSGDKTADSSLIPKYLKQKLDIIESKASIDSLRSPSPTGNIPPLNNEVPWLSEYSIYGNIQTLNCTDPMKTKGVDWLPYANQWSLNPTVFDSPLSMIDVPLSKLSLPLGRLNTPPEPHHAYSHYQLPSPLDQPSNTNGKYIPSKQRRSRRQIPPRGPDPVYVPIQRSSPDDEEVVERLALGGVPFERLPEYIKKRCKPNDLICQATMSLTPDVGINLNQFSLPYSFINLPMSFFNLPLAYMHLPFGSFNLPFSRISTPFAYNNMPFHQMIQMFHQLYIDSLYITCASFVDQYGANATEMLLQVNHTDVEEQIDCSEYNFTLEHVNITEALDGEALRELDIRSNETAEESIGVWMDLIANTSRRFKESIKAGNLTTIKEPRDALAFANDIIGKFGVPKQVDPTDNNIRRHLKKNKEIIEVLRAAVPAVPNYEGIWGTGYSLFTTPFSLFNLPFGFFDQPLAFINLPFAHFGLPLGHLPLPFADFALPLSIVAKPNFPDINAPYDSFVYLSDVPPSLLELLRPVDPLVSYLNSPLSEMNMPLAVMDLPFTVFDMPFAFMNMPYSRMNQPFTHLHLPFELSSLPLGGMAAPFGFMRTLAELQ